MSTGDDNSGNRPPDGGDRVASRATSSFVPRFGLIVVLAALIGLFSWSSEYFFTVLTFRTLLNQVPPLLVVATAMTLVLVSAQIDLSVGSVLALAGSVFGVAILDLGWPVGVAAMTALFCGLLCGLVNGLVTVRWTIPSFIVTLGMLEIARGGSYLVTGSQTQYLGSRVSALGSPISGLGLSPSVLLALAVVVAGHLLLTRTVFGRYLTAIGTNEEAVRLAGIHVRRVKIAVLALAGALAGLAGVMQTAYLESADPNAGFGMELGAIAAVVIGGTSLMGGRGSVINSFLGVLIVTVLQTGLAQIGASEPTKRIVTGAVIVIAVVADAYRQRLSWRDLPLLRRFLSKRP